MMTVKEFVDGLLCVPVTRIGNRLIVEAIEIVLDSREHKFYETLSEITHKKQSYIETAIRSAKVLGLSDMKLDVRTDIFGDSTSCPQNTEYILKSADYYRRNYENKKG